MPSIGPYLKSFGLHENAEIGGYVLKNINISHNEITRYRRYEYPITLSFERKDSKANQKMLESGLRSQVTGDRTVDSGYGNPYSCSFGSFSITGGDSNPVVTGTGRCFRSDKLKSWDDSSYPLEVGKKDEIPFGGAKNHK